MLRRELEKLRAELPQTVQADIQSADEQFAIETLDRHPPREQPTKAAWKAAAGIAWERILIERVAHLSTRHQQLTITAERWKPPNVPLDLDMIVHDSQKSVVWILDAKNADRSDDQLTKMRSQIRLLQRNPELTHGCPTIIGLIVHRRRQLDMTPQPTSTTTSSAAPSKDSPTSSSPNAYLAAAEAGPNGSAVKVLIWMKIETTHGELGLLAALGACLGARIASGKTGARPAPTHCPPVRPEEQHHRALSAHPLSPAGGSPVIGDAGGSSSRSGSLSCVP